jgi:hypothetical protein
VQLKENKGVIALRDEDYIHCDISLAVVPNGLDLQTDQPEQCGFGHNVSASGHYIITRFTLPFAEATIPALNLWDLPSRLTR